MARQWGGQTLTRRALLRAATVVTGSAVFASAGLAPWSVQTAHAITAYGCNGTQTRSCVGRTDSWSSFGGNCPTNSCERIERRAGPGEVARALSNFGTIAAHCEAVSSGDKERDKVAKAFTRNTNKCYGVVNEW